MRPFLLAAVLILALVTGCSLQNPSGYYVGFVDISGDRVKVTMDFRSNHEFFSHAEKVSTTNPVRDAGANVISLLEGDDIGIRLRLVRETTESFKISDGIWKRGWNNIQILQKSDPKKIEIEVSTEPNGDLICGMIRLSNKPGIEPITRIDVKELREKFREKQKAEKKG